MNSIGEVTIIFTSSLTDAHGGSLTVHRRVTVPVTSPVSPDVGELGVVIVPVPETTVHKPVPTLGVFPARVAVVVLHKFWSGPASALTEPALTVNTTSSVDEAQGGLLIVQRKVTVVPALRPVTPEVGELGVVIVPVPETTVHCPVPTVGVLPARVAVVPQTV